MAHRFLNIATTANVRDAQIANGSRAAYAQLENGETTHDQLGAVEAEFIAARDSFYMASVSQTGWPYIQHRGGPAGFLRVLDPYTLGFADYRGNRQYISLGNIAGDDRVALFLMDYPNRRRLKLLGRASAHDLTADPGLTKQLLTAPYKAVTERGFRIHVEAFDWNCSQHITPRFSESLLGSALTRIREKMADLEAENKQLRARLSLMAER